MWKFALRNLRSRPARSLLAVAGLTVAIAGMVGLFSVAEGLDRLTGDAFGRISGLVAMQPGAPIPLFSRLPAAWQSEIEAVDGVAVVNPEIWQRVNVIDSKMIISPPRFLFGTDIPSRLKLRHGVYREEMVEGRFLDSADRGRPHAVVSRQIAEEFDRRVGDTVTVNGYDLTIVGIYHTGSLLLDVAIILDIDVVRQMTRFESNSVSGFYIEQDPGQDEEELSQRIRGVFRGRELPLWRPESMLGAAAVSSDPIGDFFTSVDRMLKGLPPETPPESRPPAQANGAAVPKPQAGNEPATNDWHVDETSPIEIRSAIDWASRFDKFSEDLDLMLMILTSIGVTVAVLSIVNTMLMSVGERIIEFGILKANGWSKRDVVKLITCESAALGICGGILGATFGWLATYGINNAWPTRISLYAGPELLIFSVCFSTLLGIIGGVYPAVWAMRMMPMDAIRRG